MDRKEFLIKFKEYLLVEGKALSTTKIYLSHMRKFLSYIKSNHKITLNSISTTPTTTTPLGVVVSKYILYLKNKGYKENTINNGIKAINCFIDYFKLKIEKPTICKVPKRLPEHIDLSFLEDNVLPLIDEEFSRTPFRDKVVLFLMFYTGLRPSEMQLLKRKHFDFKNRTLTVYAKKTKEERVVLFPERLSKLLQEYFKQEEEGKNAFNIGAGGITYIFKKLKPYFKDINFHPYLFRHSCGVHLVGNGVDIDTTSDLFGHKNIATTTIYTKKTLKKQKEIYDKHIK